MIPAYERDGIRLYVGDCREVVPQLDTKFSAVVTDPPYGLGFMGKDWDHEVPGEAFWRVFSDAMLPGAHLLSFGGTRTYHRIAVAIEDAGFEIRDTLQWLYGSGFPKSLDVSKAIDKRGGADIGWFGPWLREERKRRGISSNQLAQHFPSKTGGETGCVRNWELSLNLPTPEQFNKLCDVLDLPFEHIHEAEREVIGNDTKARSTSGKSALPTMGGETVYESWDITAPATPEAERWQGWGTALKPAYEPIILARRPLSGTVAQNVLTHGTGALNIDACRIGTTKDVPASPTGSRHVYARGWRDQSGDKDVTDSSGWNPNRGRWPANVILDEHAAAALDQMSGERKSGGGTYQRNPDQNRTAYGAFTGAETVSYGDTGGASRFFPVLPIDDPGTLRFLYCAKASRAERNRGLEGMPEREREGQSAWAGVCNVCGSRMMLNGKTTCGHDDMTWVTGKPQQNTHPTVKPLALMRWLLTLVTPPGGIVLDPFVGSGSTLVACAQLGIPAYGIDMNEEYIEIAARRVDHALNERAREEAKPRQLSIAD